MSETPSSTGRTSPGLPPARRSTLGEDALARTLIPQALPATYRRPPCCEARSYTKCSQSAPTSKLAPLSGNNGILAISQTRLASGSTVEVRICAARLIAQPASVMSQALNCSSQIVQLIHDICSLAHPSLVCLPSLELSELDIDLPRIFEYHPFHRRWSHSVVKGV